MDILLQKAPNIEDDIVEGLIELKYISKSKFSEKLLAQKVTQAKEQLDQYRNPQKNEMGVVLVFKGWEMVFCERY